MARTYAAGVPEPTAPAVRARRPPPSFRRAVVLRVADRTPRLRRITLGGSELAGLPWTGLAASVRVLPPRGDALELPSWNGNEWLYADGSRPPIRTLTPLRVATAGSEPEVDVDVVLHGAGPLSSWATDARPGSELAIAGTGRAYELDPAATHLLLAGDESALPAIEQLLGAIPAAVDVQVVVQLDQPTGRLELPPHPRATVTWCAGLADAVRSLDLPADAHVWAAGEAAEVQKIRRHLFEEREHPRARCVVRGYWKVGRAGDDEA